MANTEEKPMEEGELMAFDPSYVAAKIFGERKKKETKLLELVKLLTRRRRMHHYLLDLSLG